MSDVPGWFIVFLTYLDVACVSLTALAVSQHIAGSKIWDSTSAL